MKGDKVCVRIVAREFEKNKELNKDSPIVAKTTFRIWLTIAACNSWTIKATYVEPAFFQGKDIARDVYIILPKESDMQKRKLWKLKKMLYELINAIQQFMTALKKVLFNLGMTQSQVDPALYCRERERGEGYRSSCHSY